MTCKSIITTFHPFLNAVNLSTPNPSKTKRGANGKFLPKPLLFHLRHPNSKTNEPKFWQVLSSPKNSFAKTSSIELALEFRQFLLWRNPTSPATTIPKKPLSSLLVPERGLEPPHPKVPGPKPGVSTNFTTPAYIKLNTNIYSLFLRKNQGTREVNIDISLRRHRRLQTSVAVKAVTEVFICLYICLLKSYNTSKFLRVFYLKKCPKRKTKKLNKLS